MHRSRKRNTRFIVAARRSYVDVWLGPVLRSAGAGVTQAPVYYDYQALVETKPHRNGKLRAAFLGSDDGLKLLLSEPAPGEPALSGNIGIATAFQRLQFRYEADPTPRTNITAVAALGRDVLGFNFGPFYFDLTFRTLSGRLEASHRSTDNVTLHAGLDMLSGLYDVSLRLPPPPRPGEPPNQPFSTRTPRSETYVGSYVVPATYVEAEITPTTRSRIVPGLRLDYANFTKRWDLSPRISGRYDIVSGFPRTTAKAGLGVFHQPPQIQESITPVGTPGLRSNRAIHYALGAEQEITKQLEVSLEGFYKQLDRLVIAQQAGATGQSEYANSGQGYVVGSELLLKYKPDDRFFGWLAYTLSRSRRIDVPGEEERATPFDQTHILTVLGSYRLGGGWEVGARFRLVSGNLVTPNVCNPGNSECDPYRVNALFHAPSGTYTPIPLTQPFSERLPLFHQLDVRIDKRWPFKSWQLSAYLDVQNAYNSPNSEAIAYNFNYTSRQYVTGLPILPSLGVRADF